MSDKLSDMLDKMRAEKVEYERGRRVYGNYTSYDKAVRAIQANWKAVYDMPVFDAWRIRNGLCKGLESGEKIASLYMEAVKNGCPLWEIPFSERTLELCVAAFEDVARAPAPTALRASTRMCDALEAAPDDVLTQGLCDLAVNVDPSALAFVPERFITYDMCVSVVKREGYDLLYVPNRLRTLELMTSAVNEDYRAFQHIDRNAIQIVLVENVTDTPSEAEEKLK